MPHEDFAAGFVIFRRKGGARLYLVIKNVAGNWELPKGHAEGEETWIQTATRELEEETGIADAKPIGGFAREIQYVFRDRKMGLIRKTVRYALSETQSSKIRLSHEHTESAFLEIDAAVGRLKFSNTRAVLREADDFL